ncbi:MAG TPA: zf-HC2 domain-containing protein, partial [Candidatus Sulfotelmatobacter sp.]|nr:zf-HC2 domain-containing protein [Candidatus Sulfotelmatobacter sp.]
MNCDGVSILLSAYLDGELTPGELLRVEEHLRRCHACADEVDSLRQTMALVSSLEEVEVPATFQVQLHQRLVALGPPVAAGHRRPAVPAWQRNARRWAIPAAAAAAALAIGVSTYNVNLPQLASGLNGGQGTFTLQPKQQVASDT